MKPCVIGWGQRELQIIGKASDLETALKLAKEKGKKTRIALLDQSLVDDNDQYDTSGRSVANELRKINPSVIIASISSREFPREFPGVDLEIKTFSSIKVFLQAVIGIAKK